MIWRTSDIASLLSTIESGSRPKGGVSSDRGDVPSLGGENVLATGGISLEGVNLVSESFYSQMTKGHLQDKDVIINKDGAQTGKVGLYRAPDDGPACINEHLFLLRGNQEKVTQQYLYYLLLSESGQRQIRAEISGSAQPGLKSGFVKKVNVSLPVDVREQDMVAEILAVLDQAIKQTDELITKQQRIKTGLMQDLLTRGIDEHGNLRSEATHKFKDSQLGRIPVEWNLLRLGEGCEICNNLRKPISAMVRETMKGDYPYYGPTGILDYINEYRIDGKYVLIGEDGDHFLKYATHEMTLLVDGKYNVNNHAHVIKGKGNVLTEWLHLFFLHRDITLYVTRQGAGRLKLNKAALQDLPMVAPKDTDEQQRIISVMDNLRTQQSNTELKLNKIQRIKTALMQDLLTGKVRVTSLLELKETTK